MQVKIFRYVLTFVVVTTFCTTVAAKPLPAQKVRVGNVVVQGGSIVRSDNAQPPRTAQTSEPTLAPALETINGPNQENEQLRRLSELSPPPRSEKPVATLQLPLPVAAEPEPVVSQQIPHTGTRSPQVSVGSQATETRVTGTEAATPEKTAVPAALTPTNDDAEVSITRALELYRQNDFEQAIKMLEEICKADPKLPPPGIFLVQFAATTGQGNRIRFWLDRATWDHPDDPEAYTLLAEFAINDNRLAEAKLLIEKGISLLGNLVSNEERRQAIENTADMLQGRLYQLREDWGKARSAFEKLAAVDKENADVFARLGFVLAHQEQYEEAITIYEQAIAKGAKLPMPKLIVSQIAEQQGKTEVADKYFNEVMKATDIDPESIRIAVQIQLSRGNITEAEKFLQQAIKSEPDNLDNLLLAGTIDLFKKDYSGAEKRFQNAILINPDSYLAAQGLAQALVEQSDTLKKERALAYVKSNVQKHGETPDSMATLAWVCFKSGKQIEAEYLTNIALGAGELSPLSAYYFAEVLAAAGQTDKADLLAKVAAASKSHFMKKAEAEALLKKLESGQIPSAPNQNTAKDSTASPAPSTETETKTPPPIRIHGTRN